jgi:hypothetical protein
MLVAGRLLLLCLGAVVALVAFAFGLVQLDLMPARWLNLLPEAMALTIAATLIATAVHSLRRRREDESE